MSAVSLATVVESRPAAAFQVAAKAQARSLSFYYGDFRALKNLDLTVHEQRVTALIGPSGCGKSTFLRCFNRMHDLYPGNRYEGEIRLFPDDTNLLAPGVDPIEVRMRLSMVFQKPNPFPKSIYENVAYGLRVRGERSGRTLDDKVEAALRGAAGKLAMAALGQSRELDAAIDHVMATLRTDPTALNLDSSMTGLMRALKAENAVEQRSAPPGGVVIVPTASASAWATRRPPCSSAPTARSTKPRGRAATAASPCSDQPTAGDRAKPVGAVRCACARASRSAASRVVVMVKSLGHTRSDTTSFALQGWKRHRHGSPDHENTKGAP